MSGTESASVLAAALWIISTIGIRRYRKWKGLDFLSLVHTRHIRVVRTEEDTARELQENWHGDITAVMGFDMEWGGGKQRVDTIQLANSHDALLIQVTRMKKIPPLLKHLLEDPALIKVGVGIFGDARKLARDWNIHLAGCVDLQLLAQSCDINLPKMGLKHLSTTLLGVSFPPNLLEQTCSQWGAPQLTSDQVFYAVADAVIGYEIAEKLHKTTQQATSTSLQHWCSQFAGITPFKSLGDDHQHVPKTPKHNDQKWKLATRQSPLYCGCKLLAPGTGELLSYISVKKAQYYVSKGIAERLPEAETEEDNWVLQLTSTHTEDGKERTFITGESFYLTPRVNLCVCCGNTENLIRFNVVPVQYRKNFPMHKRRNCSHDVLLLCYHCHQKGARMYHKRCSQLNNSAFGEEEDEPTSPTSPKSQAAKLAKQHQHKVKVAIGHCATLLHNCVMQSLRQQAEAGTERAPAKADSSHSNSTEKNEITTATTETEGTTTAPHHVRPVSGYSLRGGKKRAKKHILTAEEKQKPILEWDSPIPRRRIEQMLTEICTLLGTPDQPHETITPLLLEDLANTSPADHPDGCGAGKDHDKPPVSVADCAKAIVDQLDTDAKLEEFVSMWRQYFKTTLDPKHLPEQWDVHFVEQAPVWSKYGGVAGKAKEAAQETPLKVETETTSSGD
eukprot:TRINITY_DN52074_c0_g1_i1.p1 TRINITY_DN52074_c0_g1~~TRINITY_DN52074_c0_g1_i1.p1  ORF type:complete len:674 (-),score=69.55 TRINITY_DN52074_c0_g1_i1:553-2574(-)